MRIIILILLLGCQCSFLWGMIAYFRLPQGATIGVWMIRVLGLSFGVWTLEVFLWGPAPTISGLVFAGLAIYSLGLALFWWAWWVNRLHPLAWAFSGETGSVLSTNGPYRFIRHPFYTSYCLAWWAGPLVSGEMLLFLPAIVMSTIYILAARTEEIAILDSPMSTEYRIYKERTGSFFPRFLTL